MLRQILISLGISALITVALNAIIFLITGSLGWQNFLFFGLFFGISWPFTNKSRH